jgi:hypothetical protein
MSEGVSRRRTEHRAAGRSALKATDELFALEYLANGYNATAAYRPVYPKCSQRTAEVNGSRLLRKAEVAAFIEWERRARVKRLHMDADEALMRVSLDARADLRKLFDATGHLIEPQYWLDDIANSVESFERKKDGSFKVKLASKTMARRTILEQTGTLRSPVEGGMSALGRALRGDLGLDDGEA